MPMWRASAGPRTRTGSSAKVTIATISSKSMILRSANAIRKPSLIRRLVAGGSGEQGRTVSRTTVKIPNEMALSVNAQPKPMVVTMRTPKAGASARPAL